MGLVALWHLLGPGFKPVFSALAGGFLTTAPPGKPYRMFYKLKSDSKSDPTQYIIKPCMLFLFIFMESADMAELLLCAWAYAGCWGYKDSQRSALGSRSPLSAGEKHLYHSLERLVGEVPELSLWGGGLRVCLGASGKASQRRWG